jgi:ribosome biogenesis GTPase / thiamine phosphate phosphatase
MNLTALRAIGWKRCFDRQLSIAEREKLVIARAAAHWGSHVLCLAGEEELTLPTPLLAACGEIAVGDWLLLDPETHRGVRRLDRQSLLGRKAAGEKVQSQPIAANLDILFIVSSCNHDFNLSRLERYLALTLEADITPVVVLTRADECDDPDRLRQQVLRLKPGLPVETLDARDPQQTAPLAEWCGIGQSVGLVGSSGVGKSTLAMTLGAGEIRTQGIREDDSRGRHTTTARCLHRLDAGGLLIDTPGMRELQLADCAEGVAEVFEEIVELARQCRFRDCTHQGEPGCAVQSAIDQGTLEARRLKNYLKLVSEQARNTQTLREQRDQSRKQGRFFKSVLAAKREQRNRRDV